MFPFLTLDELHNSTPIINGRRARLAVIGNPIGHSRSPQMQQAALDAAGIGAAYIRLLVEQGELQRAVARLRELGFIGVNVTVPFKKDAAALADRRDALATLSASANTLHFTPEGIEAFNTDGPGFCRALEESFGTRPRDRRIVLLGAGGGAGAALATTCALDGCAHIVLVNRTVDRLPPLAETLIRAGLPADRIVCMSSGDEGQVVHAVRSADILVQATSLGLHAGDPLPISIESLHANLKVYDLVTHETPLQREARRRGLAVADGSLMLLYQGAEAFERWFPERRADVAAMRRALEIS